MQYPLELSFKIIALAPQIYVKDARGQELLYVRQKLLKLKEASETRACAAIALGKVRTAEAREILTKVADDKDLVVRNAVNRALRESAT